MAKNYQNEVNEAISDIDFEKNRYQIEFNTNKGNIKLDLDPQVAPNHCRNIIGLTKVGFYNGINFHRVIPDFVIQAGCPQGNGTGGPGYNVNAEFNDMKHEAGVLSMARANDPHSAGSQFFLCLAEVPYLDNQYTAFGKTADAASLEVVKKIGSVATNSQDAPLEEVVIQSAQVIVNPL